MILPLALLACPAPSLPEPSPTLLVGQATLSVDHELQRARFRLLLHEPAAAPLPSERQGIPLDGCATLVPEQRADYARVFREATVSLSCDGVELGLNHPAPGQWGHPFAELPAPGTRCTLGLDGVEVQLPPVPSPPDLEQRGASLSWTPQGADELRLSVPRAQGRSTLCRLVDDGRAPAPGGLRGREAFVSRVELDVARLDEGRLALATIAGTWL